MRVLRSALIVLSLALVAGCSATEGVPDSPADNSEAALSKLVVAGHTLDEREDKWMRFVATEVVPHLEGSRDDRLTRAARGAWWALKEGDWDAANAPGYSLCNSSSGDSSLGPLDTCGTGRAWQVGVAGVQVPGHSVADLEALAAQLYPSTSVDALLEAAASLAGHEPGSDISQKIVASRGSLRASWLLRVPAIGFTVVEKSEVVPECIVGQKSWCFGTHWDETKKFAPTRAAAQATIADMRAVLATLAP